MLGSVPRQLAGYTACVAGLGTASPATCWSDNVRRQQSAGDRMCGSCILGVAFELWDIDY